MAVDATPTITQDAMAAIATLVYEHSGIRLTTVKTALVNARLQRRLRAGGFESFDEYVHYVRRDRSGAEVSAMIDALTTSITSFFREPTHYRFLTERVVPELLGREVRSVAAWSVGCATGEEPYSMVMTLLEAFDGQSCAIDLVATDVSTSALATAAAGVYPVDRIASIKAHLLRRYFERGIDAEEGLVRVRLPIRRHVRFEHANLLEHKRLARPRDFIWCRNTLMYFDRSARERAVARLVDNLAPRGYLFVSHAENLAGFDQGLVRVAPAIYQRIDA